MKTAESNNNNENVLTAEGRQSLAAKLNNLVDIEKPKALADLNLARSQGDLSENADYDAARERCQEIESEINRIQYVLDHCVVIESSKNNKKVSLGGEKVTIKDIERNKVTSFYIVGSAEADPLNGKFSNTCPVAQACLGHVVGDTVMIHVKKPYEVIIEKIGD